MDEQMKKDMIAYRLAVAKHLSDKEKFPAFNEHLDSSRQSGVLSFMQGTMALAHAMDSCFHENMPTLECATKIEEITIRAKAAAEKIWAEAVAKANEGETIH